MVTRCGEEDVRGILEGMVERRWLIEEDGRYLALAVPAASLGPSQALALRGAMRARGELAGTLLRSG